MSLLITSSRRKVASGASVRVLNHMDRLSGFSRSGKILSSLPGVFHSWPISSIRVGLPAVPRRNAVIAAP